MTRGRLPARVYWVRRLMVLGVALLLVVGIARLLGGFGGGSAPDQAQEVATTRDTSAPVTNGPQTSDPTEPVQSPTDQTSPSQQGHHGHHGSQTTSPPSMPSGPCASNDIAISPTVKHPIAGGDVKLVFDLYSVTTPACTWRLSPTTLALKITSGSDLIWTSVQCSRLIPTEDLVLRQGDPTRVKMVWNGRRSEPGCPALTDWALAGTYHLHVAALAGKPQDVTFLLDLPTTPTVTQTVHPHGGHHHHHHQQDQQDQQDPPGDNAPSQSASQSPTQTPSG